MTDSFTDILDEWADLIDAFAQKGEQLAQEEAALKAQEAAQKKAHMSAGCSATKADTLVRAGEDWAQQYRNVQSASVGLEVVKRRIRLCEARLDVERSRNATARKIY